MAKTVIAVRGIRPGAPTTGISLPPAQRQPSMRVAGLTKSQAEELLDWLEANGYRDYHLSYTADKGFTVHYSNNSRSSG